MTNILTNFSASEFATSNGEFNYDLRALLTIQAYRSWCGEAVNVADGCRDNWATDSAHSIYLLKTYDKDDEKHVITIPATGYDITRKGMTTWELMDSVEEFQQEIYDYHPNQELFIGAAHEEGNYEILKLKHLWTGLGCYPDTNNQCIHLDMGHLSMNPVIRNKRTGVTRWIRTKIDRPLSKAGYHYANHFGESFSEMKKRLGL